MWFGVLGPLEVRDDKGELIAVGPPQRLKVLAALLLSANRPVSTGAILQTVWGEDVSEARKGSLQAHISRLRRLLGTDRIVGGPNGYVLRVDAAGFDVDLFEELIADGMRSLQHGAPQTASDRLSDALELWRGRPYFELDGTGDVEAEVARLEELKIAADEAFVDAELAAGRHIEVVSRLESLVSKHPYREELWSRLMLALYRCGRQAEALQAFNRVRERLAEELGLEPGPGLQVMADKILSQDHSLELRSSPGDSGRQGLKVATENVPVGFPAFLASLWGRSDEMSALHDLLASGNRLITVNGIGGVGKTRLVHHVALSGDAWPEGRFWVDLSSLTTGEAVSGAVAQALDLDDDRLEAAIDHLSTRRALLIFDNCEQVIDSAANAISALLTGCPNLGILATSREPLGIPGERVFRLLPLPVPDRNTALGQAKESPSVALFCERAQGADHRFELSEKNVEAVVHLCNALDGLPLAIELASAQVGFRPLDQLCSEVVPIVAAKRPSRGIPGRHRTIPAMLDWSYGLLSEPARVLYRRLSVFPGGATLGAARAVCGSDGALPSHAVEEATAQLVQASLVERDASSKPDRYRQLNVVRAHATDRLAELDDPDRWNLHHARFLAELGEQADQFRGSRQAEWLQRFDQEIDNLIHLFGWAADHDPGIGVRLVAGVGFFWLMRGRLSLGRSLIESIMSRDHSPSPNLGQAYMNAGILAGASGDHPRSEDWFLKARETFELFDQQSGMAAAESNLAVLAEDRGDLLGARQLLENAIARLSDAPGASVEELVRFASSITNLVSVNVALDDMEEAKKQADRALEAANRAGDPWTVAHCQLASAAVSQAIGQLSDAERKASEARELAIELADPVTRAKASVALGSILLSIGEYGRAVDYLDEADNLFTEVGDGFNAAHATGLLARALHLSGDTTNAVQKFDKPVANVESYPGLSIALLETGAHLVAATDPELASTGLAAAEQLRSEHHQPIPAAEESTLASLRSQLPTIGMAPARSPTAVLEEIQETLRDASIDSSREI